MRLRIALGVFIASLSAPAMAQIYGVSTYTQNNSSDTEGRYIYISRFDPETNENVAVSRYLYEPSSAGYTNNFRPDWGADSPFYFDGSANRVYIFGTRDDDTSSQAYIYYDIDADAYSDVIDATSSGFNGATAGNQEIRAVTTGGWATTDAVTTLSDLVNNPNSVQVTSNGLQVAGDNLIRTDSNGVTSIGKNSLKLQEIDGEQRMWATDASGSSIDINITNGSDLLINGKSVQGQIDENRSLIDANTTQIKKNIDNINNLAQGVAASTALTSALSSLPTVSDDSPFSCGVGTGGYSSRAAMGLGCAAKLNDRLSFNLGGSYVFGGTYSYGGGSLDTMAARGGFVFKLGKIDDSPKVAAKKAAKLHDLVSKIQDENQQLKDLLAQQSELLAATQERLERLEQVAGINLSVLGDRASR